MGLKNLIGVLPPQGERLIVEGKVTILLHNWYNLDFVPFRIFSGNAKFFTQVSFFIGLPTYIGELL